MATIKLSEYLHGYIDATQKALDLLRAGGNQPENEERQ